MLKGRPAVLLSCSERFKQAVAIPIRDRLGASGIHGIIVSAEPRLPYVDWDPDSKVESYLNAADAVIALCTADNTLSDGTVECRQNIIDEIARARHRPNLRTKIQILKAPAVRLPSNINPSYEQLDASNLDEAFSVILAQLSEWGLVPAPRSFDEAHAAAFARSDDLGVLIEGITLGDHDKARQRMLDRLSQLSKLYQSPFVEWLVGQAMAMDDESTELHVVCSLIEACNRIDPALVPSQMLDTLASASKTPCRMSAAVMCWDLAIEAPGLVPLDILSRLAQPTSEDWYVFTPAMAALQELALVRPVAIEILGRLATSLDAENRYAAATALLKTAAVRAAAVPRELARQVSRDQDEWVAAQGKELLCILEAADVPDQPKYGRFSW